MNKLTRSGIIGTGLALAAALPAHADEVSMRPYISESLMYTFTDRARHAEDNFGAMLGGGVPINRLLNLELDGAYSGFGGDDTPGHNNWKQYLGKLDAQFFFSRDPAFAPYFGIGGGYSKNVLKNTGNDAGFFGDAGLGAIHYFKIFDTDFGVRADARYRWTDVDKSKFGGKVTKGNFGEPVLSLGLIIPLEFGGTEEAAQQPLPPVAPPPPGKSTPPAGAAHRFEDVHFAFDKYSLTEYAKASLDSDATTINQLSSTYPSLKVDVAGHTDWIGTDAYNQALSERRASAVKDYLVRKGIDAGRIRTYAYGESQPVAPNTTAEGRALNRRAEISTKGE